MTQARYIALVREAPGAAPDAIAAFDRLVHARADLIRALETPLVSLAATPGHFLALGREGVILGSLLRRESNESVASLAKDERKHIVESAGRRLVDCFWGSYVAFLAGEAQSQVLRAPLGTLPCLWLAFDGAVLVSSDMELMRASGLYRPRIAWNEVVRHLALRDLRDEATCLEGIADLRGGRRLTVGRNGCGTSEVWSPWHFANPPSQSIDREVAAIGLGETVRGAVAAQAAPCGKVLLMLSGGLDSSIVAACLAQGGIAATALNLVTAEASGDERGYARQVAARTGLELAECIRDVRRVDPMRSLASRLPRPAVRMFLQESFRHARECAAQVGARAFVNGGGGDNVFCSLQSGAPVADRLRVEGIGCGALETARAISELAPARLSEVLADAVRRAWLGKPAFRIRRDLDLLAPDCVDAADTKPVHPWLSVPPGALPGKAMHIHLVTLGQGYVESLDPLDPLPTLVPLLSQPVVEVCLAIPTWLWFESGLNRAMARRAFASELPPDVVSRRSKGTPDAFVAEIFETHRSVLREMLADGRMASEGIINRQAVLAALDDPRPAHGDAFRRVLELADVEAWAACWPASA